MDSRGSGSSVVDGQPDQRGRFIRRYFDASNHVEPVVALSDLTLVPERPLVELPHLTGPAVSAGPGAQAPR